MSLPIDLSHHLTLVTGGTGELGRVICRKLAQAGSDVVVHYRGNAERAGALANELRSMGVKALPAQADVTDLQSVRAMRECVVEELGQVSCVVACAVSQIHPWSTVLEEDTADFEDQFRSCVMQNVHLAKVFVPQMVKSKAGRYIGINTECSMQMSETQSAYVSGKRGMDGVLRVLAREVGEHGITVNQVAPGWTVSEQDRKAGTEENEGYSSHVPLRRRGTDDEVANAVAFLASDLASFITGAFLPVCGGNVMPTI